MSNEVEKHKTFDERMMDRIRESIGDLITDDDLKKMIERGVEKAMFEPRQNPARDNWGNSRYDSKPSVMEEAIRDFVSKRATEAAERWIQENPDKIIEAVENAAKLGVARCVSDVLDRHFAGIFRSALDDAQNSGLVPRSETY